MPLKENQSTMIKSHFVKNTFTIWARSLLSTLLLEFTNSSRKLKLGYRTNISNCRFGKYNTIYDHVIMKNVALGNFTYVAYGSNILNTKIGKFCSVGSNVKCGLGSHPSKVFVSTHPIFYSPDRQSQVSFADKKYFEEEEAIEIGNDVWIGSNVLIMNGIKIGDGAIVASGAVVSKDVPSYAVVGGVPAKVIRYRFEEKEIDWLLNLQWWDLDVSWIKDNYLLFHDITVLMNKYAIVKQIKDES
jgi:acetyltransferase-like isoleucine patch superfamily enzyme